MSSSLDKATQTMLENIPVKTGKTLDQWYKIISSTKLDKHGQILKMLKEDHGVTHGFANTISSLFREQLAGGPLSEEDLINQQFGGAKAPLKPIYDAVLEAVSQFGSDIEIAPKKANVSLRRNKQFAIVQATTQKRVDVGLNLKGMDPTERLEGGNVFSGMCTHLVRLSSAEDVDQELVSWLKQAYNQS